MGVTGARTSRATPKYQTPLVLCVGGRTARERSLWRLFLRAPLCGPHVVYRPTIVIALFRQTTAPTRRNPRGSQSPAPLVLRARLAPRFRPKKITEMSFSDFWFKNTLEMIHKSYVAHFSVCERESNKYSELIYLNAYMCYWKILTWRAE